MGEFVRVARCERCDREWRLVGASLNPSNETQVDHGFKCECGAVVWALVPGSTNRELVRIEPLPR